jgi:predicted transposase/invertase (TIGR01784 family)
VDSRFDLYAEDHANRVVVDIQHVKLPDHYDRFLHYHCAAILEQVAGAKDYHPPLRVLTIVVLTSGDRHQVEYARIDFDPKDLQGKPLNEIAHQVIYLCPKYVSDATPEPYREWLRAIVDSLDEEVDEDNYHNPLIHKIFGLIARDGLTPQDRARMKDEYGYEAIGRDQFEKGEAKGLAEGEAKAQQKIARQMLAHGLEPETIAQLTGVPLATLVNWIQDN